MLKNKSRVNFPTPGLPYEKKKDIALVPIFIEMNIRTCVRLNKLRKPALRASVPNSLFLF